MIWKRWNWLNDGILPLSILVIRVSLLWLWLILLRRLLLPTHPGPLLSPWVMAGLFFLSMVLARITLHYDKTWLKTAVPLIGLTLLIFLVWRQLYGEMYALSDMNWVKEWGNGFFRLDEGLPPSYLLMPVIVYLWLRGALDGRRPLLYQDIRDAFVVGCLALVSFLIIASFGGEGLPPATGVVAVLFFGAAMVALAFTSLKAGRMSGVGWLRNSFEMKMNRYWVSIVLTIIAVLLLLGLLLSALIAPEFLGLILDVAWQIMQQVLILLVKLISLLLYPLALLLAYLIS